MKAILFLAVLFAIGCDTETFVITETAEPTVAPVVEPEVKPEPPAPQPEPPAPKIEVAKGCCNGCPCKDCQCEKTGVRCCYECPCVPCTAIYCCAKCGECRQYRFPKGRPCEPAILCPKCMGLQHRRDQKKAAAVIERINAIAAQRAYQAATCRT